MQLASQPVMTIPSIQSHAAWRAADLDADGRWIFVLDEAARRDLLGACPGAHDAGRHLFDYRRGDFDFGAAWPAIAAALEEVRHGRGVALVRGLPRESLDERGFERLTWAIGLHAGVARPQGRQTHYISAVRDAGTAYRTGTGRGYSSNAELDFHTDSADIVVLSCYNRAASGGMSITTSSLAAYEAMTKEYPDLVEWLHRPIPFSRQGEEAPDEDPIVLQPVFDHADGRLFSRWNWNRVNSAQALAGVPRLAARQQEALDRFDSLVRRPDLAHSLWLEPGDLQIINSHVTLHSRTHFEDHPEPARARLLFRLWIAPPESDRLPESWRALYRAVEPGTVRGGIRGQQYDTRCAAFERRQAADLGMKVAA